MAKSPPPTCPCGLSYVVGHPGNEALHAKHHTLVYDGVPLRALSALTPSVESDDGLRIFCIDSAVDGAIRRAVAVVPQTAQYTMQDFPIGYDGTVDDRDQSLFIAAQDGVAIGMCVTSVDAPHHRFRWLIPSAELVEGSTDLTTRRTIARIWVAVNHQRKGIARRLVEAVTMQYRIAPPTLGWELPLTGNGAALVRAVVPGEWWGRGDSFAIRETLKARSELP